MDQTPVDLRTEAAYVRGDLKAMLNVIAKLEKPLTSPSWEQEAKLLIRQSERCRRALSQFERALEPKPARAASAKGGKVKPA